MINADKFDALVKFVSSYEKCPICVDLSYNSGTGNWSCVVKFDDEDICGFDPQSDIDIVIEKLEALIYQHHTE